MRVEKDSLRYAVVYYYDSQICSKEKRLFNLFYRLVGTMKDGQSFNALSEKCKVVHIDIVTPHHIIIIV